MCWRVDEIDLKEDTEKYHKIAHEDMNVYKLGFIFDGEKVFKPVYRYEKFSYKSNELNEEINLTVKPDGLHWVVINKGYHSYSKFCSLVHSTVVNNILLIYSPTGDNIGVSDIKEDSTCAIGEFIIPKETNYYINEDGEIVSSQLVWTGKAVTVNEIEAEKCLKFKDLNMTINII